MMIRPSAEIWADFPDDGVEEEDRFILFPGRGITEAVAEKFQALGYEVGVVEHEGEHGWTFDVRIHGKYIFFQLTDFGGGEYLLVSSCATILAKPEPQRAKLLHDLNIELGRDSRFKEVRWVVKDDIHAGTPGHPRPVDERDVQALLQSFDEAATRTAGPSSDQVGGQRVGLMDRLFSVFRRR
jgi:hypothetical protein